MMEFRKQDERDMEGRGMREIGDEGEMGRDRNLGRGERDIEE